MTSQESPPEQLTLADMASYTTVQHWLQAYGSHWNRSAEEAERRRKTDVLRRYCEVRGRDPDLLVSSLFRETPEGPRIRLKRRRLEMAKIDEFEATSAEGDLRRGREVGNIVRSFFIHNGVALTATPFR